MNSLFAQTKISVVLTGALLIALGIAILANPGGVTLFVTRLVGWACALGGAVILVSSFASGIGMTVIAVGGGILLALGILIIVNPEWFVNLLLTLMGMGILLSGIGDVARAGEMRAAGFGIWRLTMTIGIATLIVGVVVVIAPFALISVASLVAGISLVADGLSELFLAWRM